MFRGNRGSIAAGAAAQVPFGCHDQGKKTAATAGEEIGAAATTTAAETAAAAATIAA